MSYKYKIEMRHTEKTFEALARMQYDLFCKSNRIARTCLSAVAIVAGVVNYSAWWGILVIAYGCYLITSTYSSANHTARKLTEQLRAAGAPFPASSLQFQGDALEVVPLNGEGRETIRLPYTDILRLGEDMSYFYLFRDQYGGYMVPKEALGDRTDAFRSFLEGKTGLSFRSRKAPILRLADRLQKRGHGPQG